MPWTNEQIAAETDKQVRQLFPSARGLKLEWHSIVKIAQSLYEEAPGMDVYRPDQVRPRKGNMCRCCRLSSCGRACVGMGFGFGVLG